MTDLEQILDDFRRDVARAEHLLMLIKSFREFGASTPPQSVLAEETPWPEAVNLTETSRARRTDLPVLSGSLLLYLSGRFEYFVRQVVESAAEDIAANATVYADLPKNLRAELKARTLEIASNPSRYSYDDAEVEVLLGSLVANLQGAQAPLTIASETLSITEANMKDRVLAELMKRVGMLEYWREVGKQAQIKLFLEKVTDGEATVEAQKRLNNIMDERNQIAHPTAETQFPDPDQVLGSAKFLQKIANVTTELLQVYLTSLRQAA